MGQVFGRILELSYPDAEWLAMMHAAAVGDAEGAVVMAGDSGSGKSTLTAALVDAGLSYFSDDVVPLDQALRIRPMPLAHQREGRQLAGAGDALSGARGAADPRRPAAPLSADRADPHRPGRGAPGEILGFSTLPTRSTNNGQPARALASARTIGAGAVVDVA